MKEIFKRFNKKIMKRQTAWLLIMVMVITCVNPATFALAAKNNSWSVNWTAEVDGDAVETYKNQASFYVEEGQAVNFILELMEENIDNPNRFKETFEISLPEYLYDLITEDGESPIDWETMSDFLLEAVEEDVKATDSNARAIRRYMVGTSSNATSSNANKATDSNSRSTMRTIKLRFNKELRSEESPETMELGDAVHSNLAFVAPEDMVLICTQKNNTYEIKMVPVASASDALLKPLMSTDSWDVTWEFMINGVKQEEGEDIIVDIGDVVKFNFNIQLKEGEKPNYNDTFNLTMPTKMYDIIGDFTWHQLTGYDKLSHDLFTSTVSERDQQTIITISFAEYFNGGEGNNIKVTTANSDFGFTSKEKVTISYEQNEENDTTEITYEEPKIVEPTINVTKYISDIFNKETRKATTSAVEAGDYIRYQIAVTLVDGKEGVDYPIDAISIFDCFNGDVYKFIDLSDVDVAEKLEETVSGTDMGGVYKNPILGIISTEKGVKMWEGPLDPVPDYEIPNKDIDGYVVYGHTQDHVLTSTDNKLILNVFLQVKEDIDLSDYTDADLKNNAYLAGEGKGGSAGPTVDGYYDQALQIYPVSIRHENASGSTLVGKPFSFPDILDNSNVAVVPGDFVTFRTTTYEQGTWPSKIKSMEIYVPMGFEPIASFDQLPEGFRYAINTEDTKITGKPNAANGGHKYLDSGHLSGTFKLEDYHVGESQGEGISEYVDLVQVKRYTYTFDEPVAKGDIYVTCKVKDIDTILAEADMKDTPENRILAERYGYLISAEISEIVDAKKLFTVDDEDSWIDNFPFNDWYNNKEGDYKKLKHKNLYYYIGDKWTNCEKDGVLAQHVRSLTNKWSNTTGMYDEDDFDYAIVYLYETGKLTDSKGIAKEVRPGDPESKEVADLLKEIDRVYDLSGDKAYSEKYHTLKGGQLSQTQTIVPYVVYINGDGSKTMKDVIFTDELPETMSFLTLPNGNPVAAIFERIEDDGYRFPVTDKDGKTVEIILEEYASNYCVKNYLDDDFYKESEELCYRPGGILSTASGDKWDFGVQDNTLTINFGDIDNNAYYVIYLAVVDKVSNTYNNSASIVWEDNPKVTVGADFDKWDGQTGRGYSKTVLNNEGEYVEESKLENIDRTEEIDLTYRLFITINGTRVYEPKDLIYYDYLDDLFGGERPDNIEIKDITYRDGDGIEIKPEDSSFETTFDDSGSKLIITNKKELISEASYIYFSVKYKEIPYGTTIKNTFGISTTEVETPIKLDLIKVNGDTEIGLEDAVFALYYDEELENSVKDDGQSITFTTEKDGKASAEFYLNDSYADVAGNFNLYLKETATPDGYYQLGGKDGDPSTPYIIKLKVTKDANSKYIATAIDGDGDYFEVSTGDLNEIQVEVKNYKGTPDPIDVSMTAKKNLDGRPLAEGEFTFHAKLVETVAGSTVTSNGTIINQNDSLAAVTNGAGGTIAFPLVELDKDGYYIFELCEMKGNANGIIYDENKYYALVEVIEDPVTHGLNVAVTYHKSYVDNELDVPIDGVPEFENTYKPESTILNLKLNKKLYGADGTEKPNLPEYKFTVDLIDGTVDAVTIPESVVINKADGLIEVNDIKIKEAGTYVFEIKESLGSDTGTIYDDATITVVVVVENEDNAGLLKVKSTEYGKSKFTGSENNDTFVNTILPTDAELKADKNLTGRTLKANEFTFNARLVKTVSGATVKSDQNTISLNGTLKPVRNTLTGTVDFPEVEFNKVGSYIFELSEDTTGGAADITYDKTKYFALVNVSENAKTKGLSAVVTYHDSYNNSTQTVGNVITLAIPKFENAIKGLISIRKISASSGIPLAGAKFTISYQLKGSNDGVWTPLYTDLETTGSDGSVSFELPDKYWTYNYKIIETKSPSGYKTSRVGTIFFTVAQDGTIDTWSNDGSSGYVEISNDKIALIVKNQREDSGGGGGDPEPTKPIPTKPTPTDPTPTDPSPTDPSPTLPYKPDPDKPGIVVPPGEIIIDGPDGPVYEGKTPDGHIDIELPPGLYKITVIGDDGIPLTYFMEVPVPLSGLARTGDTAASALMLAVIMLAALGSFGTLVYVKRKKEKSE